MNDIFFFGCAKGDQSGHRMKASRYSTNDYMVANRFMYSNPWRHSIDGSLAPAGREQKQGQALLHRKNGWTAISFWDRTGDSRMGSNSAFLAKGDYTFAEMINLASAAFPEIMASFKFPIVELI